MGLTECQLSFKCPAIRSENEELFLFVYLNISVLTEPLSTMWQKHNLQDSVTIIFNLFYCFNSVLVTYFHMGFKLFTNWLRTTLDP